jgi:hypothetical protein
VLFAVATESPPMSEAVTTPTRIYFRRFTFVPFIYLHLLPEPEGTEKKNYENNYAHYDPFSQFTLCAHEKSDSVVKLVP